MQADRKTDDSQTCKQTDRQAYTQAGRHRQTDRQIYSKKTDRKRDIPTDRQSVHSTQFKAMSRGAIVGTKSKRNAFDG